MAVSGSGNEMEESNSKNAVEKTHQSMTTNYRGISGGRNDYINHGESGLDHWKEGEFMNKRKLRKKSRFWRASAS